MGKVQERSNVEPVALGIGAAGTDWNPLSAVNGLPVKGSSYTQRGYQQIDNTTLAGSTALTVPSGATVALVQNNGTQPCRWRPDGSATAPTPTTGQRIAGGEMLTLDIGNAGLVSSRFIREADGVTLDITYYS